MYSPLDFGRELETKGDTACLARLDTAPGIMSPPLSISIIVEESARMWCAELLLRI